MRDNPKIAQFIDKLNAAGVHHRTLWLTRRDGEPKLPQDVFFVEFIGDGFVPNTATAIVIDYRGREGKAEGFGFYTDPSDNPLPRGATIDELALAIAKPRPEPGKAAPDLLVALKALRHVAVWDDDSDREEFDKALAMADIAINAAEGRAS